MTAGFLGGSREVVFSKNVSTIQICVYLYIYIYDLYIFIKTHQNLSKCIKVIPVIFISTHETNSNLIG